MHHGLADHADHYADHHNHSYFHYFLSSVKKAGVSEFTTNILRSSGKQLDESKVLISLITEQYNGGWKTALPPHYLKRIDPNIITDTEDNEVPCLGVGQLDR